MKARVLGLLYALAGIALTFALTFGAYVLAGPPESPVRPVAVRNELAPRPTPTPDGRDISGPCDEREHANDPECAPGGEDHPSADDDNSGRGSDDDSGSDGDGSGSDSDRSDDSSGSGSDDDSGSDDGSGSDDSDDSSGSGSDDSGGDD